jgi:hypothetical protein
MNRNDIVAELFRLQDKESITFAEGQSLRTFSRKESISSETPLTGITSTSLLKSCMDSSDAFARR